MASDVTICSAALMLVGDNSIASLSDNTRRAALCAGFYELAKDDVLRAHTWNCLVTRQALSPLAAAPANEWSYQFTLPGNWLRTLSVSDEDGRAIDYVTEGRRILANESTIYLRFIERKTEGNWDSHLVDVMVKRMVKDLAYPLTKSASFSAEKRDEYRDALKLAKSVDGQENPPEDYGDSPLISVRGG